MNLTAAELANLSELTFTNQPSASTPILINVTGGTFTGQIPNLAGVSGSQAPYMMWNFPTASEYHGDRRRDDRGHALRARTRP